MTKEKFFETIFKNYVNGKDIVLINIGTNKLAGDSYGPLLGTLLKDKLSVIYSYGTLDDPIHYKNLEDRVNEIKRLHPNAYMIAVDACFSKNEDNCNIPFIIDDKGIYPGKGFGKDSFLVGDASIKFCIKEIPYEDSYETLQKEYISKLYFNAKEAYKMIKRFDNILRKTLKGSDMNVINN